MIKLGIGGWGGSLVRGGGTPESLGFRELSGGWDGFSPWLTPARGRGGGSSLVPLWLPCRSVTGSRRLGDSTARGGMLTARVESGGVLGVAIFGVTVQLLFGTRRPFPLCGFLLELFPPPGLLPLESFKLKCHYYTKSRKTPPLPGPSQNLTLPSAPQHVAQHSITKGGDRGGKRACSGLG